jgi:ubiquinone/menaquinone biosynthesis C-methylase UbiE
MPANGTATRPDPTLIVDLASAFYGSCVLFTSSDLGVYSKLAELGTADAATLAQAMGTDVRATTLLLDACVALGLLTKTGNTYRNTPSSAVFLVPGQPGDLSRAIRFNRDVYDAWGKLPELVSKGVPVEKPELHLGEDLERTRTFVLSMHGRAMGIGRAVVAQLNLKGRKRMLDIGGGPGTYSSLIVQANRGLKSTVLDLPGVVAVATELLAQAGVSDRVATLPGDYHTTPFPAGNDVVIIFGVLHQESPKSICDILKRAFDSLTPGGTIYMLDLMTDATHTAPVFSALFAVNMALIARDGWVFSAAELKTWLEQAGFTGFEVSPLHPPMPHWLVQARKP